MYLHNPDRLTMSVEEAGKLLGIGTSSAYGAIRGGELPSLKIGRRILVASVSAAQTAVNRLRLHYGCVALLFGWQISVPAGRLIFDLSRLSQIRTESFEARVRPQSPGLLG